MVSLTGFKPMASQPKWLLISSTTFITRRDFSNLSSPKRRIESLSAGVGQFSFTPAFSYLYAGR